jgi:hypothetical protein
MTPLPVPLFETTVTTRGPIRSTIAGIAGLDPVDARSLPAVVVFSVAEPQAAASTMMAVIASARPHRRTAVWRRWVISCPLQLCGLSMSR